MRGLITQINNNSSIQQSQQYIVSPAKNNNEENYAVFCFDPSLIAIVLHFLRAHCVRKCKDSLVLYLCDLCTTVVITVQEKHQRQQHQQI